MTLFRFGSRFRNSAFAWFTSDVSLSACLLLLVDEQPTARPAVINAIIKYFDFDFIYPSLSVFCRAQPRNLRVFSAEQLKIKRTTHEGDEPTVNARGSVHAFLMGFVPPDVDGPDS